ncbi:MAG: hypothetical protein Q4G48_05575 [Bacteroidia bacterium]|nr:hypothetical protein [Bacteroidia bacterium]
MLILAALFISWRTGIYLLAVFIIPITISIIAPFFDIPSLKRSGKLIYHSSLFLSEKPQNKVIKIHGGTLFDYVFVIDRNMNGKQRVMFILGQYLEGLSNLIERYAKEDYENLIVRGTSYIVNVRTAERLGFTINETDFLQKIILIYNYFNILLANSIANGKLSFPKLSNTKTFEAKLSELIERKEYLRSLSEKLKISVAGT